MDWLLRIELLEELELDRWSLIQLDSSCLYKYDLSANAFPHRSQTYGLELEWVWTWARRFDLSANALVQMWHLNGFSPARKYILYFKDNCIKSSKNQTHLCVFECVLVTTMDERNTCHSKYTDRIVNGFERASSMPALIHIPCHSVDISLPSCRSHFDGFAYVVPSLMMLSTVSHNQDKCDNHPMRWTEHTQKGIGIDHREADCRDWIGDDHGLDEESAMVKRMSRSVDQKCFCHYHHQLLRLVMRVHLMTELCHSLMPLRLDWYHQAVGTRFRKRERERDLGGNSKTDEGGEEENECAINYAGCKIWNGRVDEREREGESWKEKIWKTWYDSDACEMWVPSLSPSSFLLRLSLSLSLLFLST